VWHVLQGPYRNILGLIEATVSGGYDSTHLDDGDVYTFSLCERCLKELIDSFKLYAKQGNYLFPEEDQPGFDRRKFVGEGITFWADLTEEERAKWREEIEKDSVLDHLDEVPRTELIVWLFEVESREGRRDNDAEIINAIRTELKRRKNG
jgi:hypothetical protein